jgi:hypothetical protein
VEGVGQGVEGQHDVWRRMSPAALDRIRITSVTQDERRLRIEADITGAYPEAAALTQFRRVFSVEPGRFTVQDEVATSSPKRIEWYFHSDVPIVKQGDGFVLGGTPGLRLSFEAPDISSTVEPTILMAPGKPGSITSGEQERRGFHVKLQSAPSTSVRLRAVLELKR